MMQQQVLKQYNLIDKKNSIKQLENIVGRTHKKKKLNVNYKR